jgi:hypothetical protein
MLLSLIRTSQSPLKGPPGPSLSGEEYLSIWELCARIPYAVQTIRNKISHGELREGVHFVKRRRKVIFLWTAMQRWLKEPMRTHDKTDPFYGDHDASAQ